MTHAYSAYLYADETDVVQELLSALEWDDILAKKIEQEAIDLVNIIRNRKNQFGHLETFLQQYSLDTKEGRALMTLAEALLRIPDNKIANDLIEDKISAADWLSDMGKSAGLMTKAAGMGLSLTQKTLGSGLGAVGKPVIREATVQAIRIMGRQFVLGQSIEDALKRGQSFAEQGYRFSYDMLGEGARTAEDAETYFEAYQSAINVIGQNNNNTNTESPSGISVKLSALHPRYEYANKDECVPALADKLYLLAEQASSLGMGLSVDAEEVDRLETSLDIIEAVLERGDFSDWNGFGIVIQAYQKRCFGLIDRIAAMGKTYKQHIRVRLVKGAYWDTEIKRAQVMGLVDYPVFTRKANTDVSYLACAQKLFQYQEHIFPMFATHNAHTMIAIKHMAEKYDAPFELQRLHCMGESLYEAFLKDYDTNGPVTIYAPVGNHEDLLPYLVRRLLENGANSSFVNKLLDDSVEPRTLVEDPVAKVSNFNTVRHPKIPLPASLYENEGNYKRENSSGFDITAANDVEPVLKAIQNYKKTVKIGPLVGGKLIKTNDRTDINNPANNTDIIGTIFNAEPAHVEDAFKIAQGAFKGWANTDVEERAQALERFADLLEENEDEFMAILNREAGKTVSDAHDEIREAVDFARYYANRGRELFSSEGHKMQAPTGESNILSLHGRGVFVCISPWNFPLAIFAGQVLAALMAGNAVLAKPADQTPLVAYRAIELMHEAGIPKRIVNLITGRGSLIGDTLTGHKDVAGVAFTGSTEIAHHINRTLAAKTGPIVPFIAETGGQNAMIVDSSALPEQVVDDVTLSAFGSAGQRCSALRILCVQDEIADKLLHMLKGAMRELKVGDPKTLPTDVGPVIDTKALETLENHKERMLDEGELLHEVEIDEIFTTQGNFFGPCAFEINDISILEREVFGPILHIVRFRQDNLDTLIENINGTGYGLTFGVHSRVESFQKYIAERIDAGNIYVNRSMIGAIVGAQPFGGQGLSGTGPKAGGPHYLLRFATEKTISVDTTASGGNASLVSIEE
ncbi:MAG: bifunctional proline dehydrogenase/L-glutamate gamma-semialdehyde dehydrogenase PutA [Pseudomonadota bacterium]